LCGDKNVFSVTLSQVLYPLSLQGSRLFAFVENQLIFVAEMSSLG